MPRNLSYNVAKISCWIGFNFDDLFFILPLEEQSKLLELRTVINVEGLKEIIIDISSVVANFGINELPTCTVGVALGRRADDTSLISDIHLFARRLKQRIRINVYTQIEATDGDVENWPINPDGSPKAFRIFEGKLSSSAFSRAFGATQLLLTLDHWLADMNLSSAISATSSAANPLSLSFNATAALADFTGARGNNLPPVDTPLVWLADILTPDIMKDFWGGRSSVKTGGLKLFLRSVCLSDRFNFRDVDAYDRFAGITCAGDPNRIKNNDSLEALDRFEPFFDFAQELIIHAAGVGAGDVFSVGDYTFGVPLKLHDNIPVVTVASMLGQDIASNSSARSLANVTLWDRIVGKYCPDYLTCLVPMVDRALIVPFIPGLQTPFKTLFGDEYSVDNFVANIPRNIRGVVLVNAQIGAITGATGRNIITDPPNQDIAQSAGAIYDTCQPGMFYAKYVPPWLANITPSCGNMGNNLLNTQVPSMTIGNILGAAVNVVANPNDPQGTTGVFNLYVALAKSYYLQEVLRHRQASLMGKLRFDIAPGSEIAWEVVEDEFVEQIMFLNDPPKQEFMQGTVLRVTIDINTESQKAGTAFQVGFVRNDAENNDERFSTNTHPLWDTRWTGAPLINEGVFRE